MKPAGHSLQPSWNIRIQREGPLIPPRGVKLCVSAQGTGEISPGKAKQAKGWQQNLLWDLLEWAINVHKQDDAFPWFHFEVDIKDSSSLLLKIPSSLILSGISLISRKSSMGTLPNAAEMRHHETKPRTRSSEAGLVQDHTSA